jgi:ribosome-associated protein
MILKTATQLQSKELALIIAEAADDRKAGEITILDVGEISYITDYFVILTGYSRTQTRAIADSIDEKLSKNYDRQPLGVEGKNDASWIVQDYGNVIVHIFLPQERDFYNLEAFWGHASRLEFPSAS